MRETGEGEGPESDVEAIMQAEEGGLSKVFCDL